MSRRTKTVILLVALGLSAVGAGLAWHLQRADNPAEQGYGDIDREAYESWMQDLGYTE